MFLRRSRTRSKVYLYQWSASQGDKLLLYHILWNFKLRNSSRVAWYCQNGRFSISHIIIGPNLLQDWCSKILEIQLVLFRVIDNLWICQKTLIWVTLLECLLNCLKIQSQISIKVQKLSLILRMTMTLKVTKQSNLKIYKTLQMISINRK